MNKSESIVNLVKAVVSVMQEVKGIEKTMQIGTGSNSYKGIADQEVKKVIGTAMAANGLCILPIDVQSKTSINRWEETNNYGTSQKQSVFTEATTKYILAHVSGEFCEVAGYGQGVDSQDKSGGKSTTYAEKYLLLYMFLVPTGKIDDADNTHSNDISAPGITNKVEENKEPVKPTMSQNQFETLKARISSALTLKDKENLMVEAEKYFIVKETFKTEFKKLIK